MGGTAKNLFSCWELFDTCPLSYTLKVVMFPAPVGGYLTYVLSDLLHLEGGDVAGDRVVHHNVVEGHKLRWKLCKDSGLRSDSDV